MKEADYGCDDKNPCCDGLSCKIVQGHSQWLKVPKCIKDSSGNKYKSLIQIKEYLRLLQLPGLMYEI